MSDSFVLTLPLKTNPSQEKALHIRLEAGRQLYNACLGEVKKRFRLMAESKAYRAACKMPKGEIRSQEANDRSQAFLVIRNQYGCHGQYSLDKFSIKTTHACWMHSHITNQIRSRIAIRAYKAVEDAFFAQAIKKTIINKQGQQEEVFVKPNVHFKRKDNFRSLEGTTNTEGLRYKDGIVYWKGRYVKKLMIPCIINHDDPVIRYGLKHRIKFCRLLKKTIKGKVRYYVQLVLEGKPLQKYEFPKEVVGLDLGPSTIAYYTNGHKNIAELETFCAELEQKDKEIRVLQRKIDRQRRANNPDNYNPDGTSIKGRRQWIISNRQRQTENQLAEFKRKEREYRKSLHGQLANKILQLGCIIKTENISYLGFQKMFGKSVDRRAPGMFMEMLRRKAKDAGGEVIEFSTNKTALSQICHKCEQRTKKPLEKRWHTCCDMNIQRDIYSAFLASFVEDDTLDIAAVQKQWPSVELMLEQAMSKDKQVVRKDDSSVKSVDDISDTRNVVPEQLLLF